MDSMVLIFIASLAIIGIIEMFLVGTFNLSPTIPAAIVGFFGYMLGLSQANTLTVFVVLSIIGYVVLANLNTKNQNETKFNIDRLIGRPIEITDKYLTEQIIEIEGEIWKAEKIQVKLHDKVKITGVKGNILQLETWN